MINETLRIKDHAEALVERPSGIHDAFRPKGHFKVEHYNKNGELLGIYEFPNGITDVGLNAILDVKFNSGSQITAWYIGLIDNASFSTLAPGDVMNSHAGWIENNDYSQATRPAWTSGAAAARAVTNASTVDFSVNANGKTIKGIFITSVNTKSGTTGELWSTATFGSTVAVNSGDTLKVTYSVSG